MRILAFFVAFLGLVPTFFAQEVKATIAINPTNVQEKEVFMITVTSNTDGNPSLNLPSAFEILNQQKSVSSSSSMTVIINGRVQRSSSDRTINYNYTCRISRAGAYTISDAKFNSVQGTIPLNRVSIIVSKAPPVTNNVISNLGKNFFGVIQVSRTKVYVGEPISLYAKVYSKARITDFNEYTPSEITGTVYKTDLFKNKQLQVKAEQIQGIDFQTLQISEQLLIPQEAGTINCKPFHVKMGYQKSFFVSDYVDINSASNQIKVLPLPGNAPEGFKGAVGTYSVSTSLSKKQLKEGDAFTYKIVLSGKGNIHLLSTPELQLPDEFELYGDPKITDNHIVNQEGGSGTITYEYTIQALEQGTYTFKPYQFAYFDPKKEQYISIPIPTETINVEKGVGNKNASSGNGIKNDVSLKNEGIKYIALEDEISETNFLWTKFIFWLLVSLPLILGIPLGVYLKRRNQFKDVILANQLQKKAGKTAIKRLQKATDFLKAGDKQSFNEEIHTVFKSFLAQKLKCATSEVTREKLSVYFEKKTIDSQIIEQIMQSWNDLEMTKYGLSDLVSSEQLLQNISSLIEKLDSQWN